MLSRAVRPVVRNILTATENSGRQVRAYHEPAHLKPTTLNDLPTPQGSWQSDYNAKQSKYNLHLLAGILFTLGSLGVAKASGLFYFNMSPPDLKK